MDLKKISAILWFLSALFCLRVLAQLTASVVDTTFLPAFEDWHSGTMPYGLLAFFQIVILFFMAKTALRFSRKQVRPSKRTGVFILIIGSIYFFAMVLRMTLGLTLYTESRWFSNYLSTAFHYVLALYLLLVGWHHHKMAQHKLVNLSG
ncbi:MAG: hypothetical protein E2O76_00920 [Caldithrix sp.]|nr:MAG: hypothetical protein E2O76_00920 [Caldithrix sp.]